MPSAAAFVGLPMSKSTLFTRSRAHGVAARTIRSVPLIRTSRGAVPDPSPRATGRHRPAREIVPDCVSSSISQSGRRRLAGRGTRHQFLSHIREVDAIAHVVRWLESGDVSMSRQDRSALGCGDHRHGAGTRRSCDLWRRAGRAPKAAKSGGAGRDSQARPVRSVKAQLNAAQPLRALGTLTQEERCDLRELQLLHGKAGHVRRQRGGAWLREQSVSCSARERARRRGRVVVAVCAAIEAEIAQLEEGRAPANFSPIWVSRSRG